MLRHGCHARAPAGRPAGLSQPRCRRAAAVSAARPGAGGDDLNSDQQAFLARKTAQKAKVQTAREKEEAEMRARVGTHGDEITDDQMEGLDEAQKAFLKRKAAVLKGGDIMEGVPLCKPCEGTGRCACSQCGGTGKNNEEKFKEEGAQLSTAVPGFSVQEGGPCWLCRGMKEMPCQRCTGTGRGKMAAISFPNSD